MVSLMAITVQEPFERATDAFNAQDLDRLADVLADDVVLCAPGILDGDGKAVCLDYYRSWFDDFPDAHVEVHSRHVIEDLVLEEGTFTGTHDGVAGTGRSVALDYLQVVRSRHGKHVSVTLMFDRLLMLEQLGLIDGADAGSAGNSV